MKNTMLNPLILVSILSICFVQCGSQVNETEKRKSTEHVVSQLPIVTSYDSLTKTIHVLVALCDNRYQGIVPVPEKIGNGQDPDNNLYWGCAYGIRTFFKKSTEWKLVKTQKIDSLLLERLVFKHTSRNYYLVADAYNGKYIKDCTKDFLYSCAGQMKDTLHIKNSVIGIYGNSKLISYIGHNGLMDFQLEESFKKSDSLHRECIILACISKRYFNAHVKSTNASPVVWTTGLMCPEAYTLHAALTGYINKESNEAIRARAATAYSTYQKCSQKAALGLLVSGW